jgi:hypothetical protein
LWKVFCSPCTNVLPRLRVFLLSMLQTQEGVWLVPQFHVFLF